MRSSTDRDFSERWLQPRCLNRQIRFGNGAKSGFVMVLSLATLCTSILPGRLSKNPPVHTIIFWGKSKGRVVYSNDRYSYLHYWFDLFVPPFFSRFVFWSSKLEVSCKLNS